MRTYSTGSEPGKFYGTAKKHKIPVNGTINDLPLRPIISSIGTASYQNYSQNIWPNYYLV